MSHDFPTVKEVIVMHEALIGAFGGIQGIRDEGALASALMRPQLGYYDGLGSGSGGPHGEPGQQ